MANDASLPVDPVAGTNTDEERTDEETEACYESDDFPVLESQLITEANPNPPVSAVDPDDEVVWSARNSFTADSPYFDAFLDSETASLSTLSQALNCIAARTRTFVKQGAVMSEATRRLGLACKLRSNDYDATTTPADDEAGRSDELAGTTTEEELVRQKRNAVGEEMAGILELLGEVRRPLDETGFTLSRLASHLRPLRSRCTPLAVGF
jgi:hypothetical protein